MLIFFQDEAAAAAAGDQSRFVKLDWDILGAALESIGGLDPNHPTSVEVVSAEGESQQIIIQVIKRKLY